MRIIVSPSCLRHVLKGDSIVLLNETKTEKKIFMIICKEQSRKKTTMVQKKDGTKNNKSGERSTNTSSNTVGAPFIAKEQRIGSVCVSIFFLIDIPGSVSQKPCKVRTRRIRSWKVNFTISGCYYVLRGFIVFDILSLDLSFGFNLKREPNNLVDNQKQIKQH